MKGRRKVTLRSLRDGCEVNAMLVRAPRCSRCCNRPSHTRRIHCSHIIQDNHTARPRALPCSSATPKSTNPCQSDRRGGLTLESTRILSIPGATLSAGCWETFRSARAITLGPLRRIGASCFLPMLAGAIPSPKMKSHGIFLPVSGI